MARGRDEFCSISEHQWKFCACATGKSRRLGLRLTNSSVVDQKPAYSAGFSGSLESARLVLRCDTTTTVGDEIFSTEDNSGSAKKLVFSNSSICEVLGEIWPDRAVPTAFGQIFNINQFS